MHPYGIMAESLRVQLELGYHPFEKGERGDFIEFAHNRILKFGSIDKANNVWSKIFWN